MRTRPILPLRYSRKWPYTGVVGCDAGCCSRGLEQRRLRPACCSKVRTAGVLREVTGRKRDRIWRYDSYVDLFDEVTGQVEQDATLSGNVHGPVAQVHK